MSFSEKDKELIAAAVKKVELSTSGEIVPMIVKASDLYPAAHFRAGLTLGSLCALATYYSYDFSDPVFLLIIQFLGMITGYLLAYLSPIKRAFSSQREMNEEVHQRAIEAFYKNHVSMTKDRTGILIFISLLEHKIEVLADSGINANVSANFWNEVVSHLGQKIAQGKLAEGMVEAIHKCGETLSLHFPRKEGDTNEIEDLLRV